MDDDSQKAQRIADESVGARLGRAPPDEVKARAEMSPDEAVRQLARSAGPEASAAERAAESVGERVGDAYPDQTRDRAEKGPGKVVRQAGSQASDAGTRMQATGRQAAQFVYREFDEQPFISVFIGFVLGYIAALTLHGRR